MALARLRSTAVVVVLFAVAVSLLGPVAGREGEADAAGRAYQVHSWTDPKGDQHRVRWNPCQTITYAVNLAKAGRTPAARASALRDVRRAFDRVSNRTGLKFSFSGRTKELPKNTPKVSWSERQRAAEIVVAWVDQTRSKYRSNLLGKSNGKYPSGVGGWMLKGWTDARGRWQAAVGRGFVVINARQNQQYKSGFGSGVTRGALLLHELGHAIGLDHVGSTNELMYPTMLRREHSNYKRGDSMGLHRLGRRLGCIPGTKSVWPQI